MTTRILLFLAAAALIAVSAGLHVSRDPGITATRPAASPTPTPSVIGLGESVAVVDGPAVLPPVEITVIESVVVEDGHTVLPPVEILVNASIDVQ